MWLLSLLLHLCMAQDNVRVGCADGPGFDFLTDLRADMRAHGRVSDRALVICSGEGTTATRSVAALFHYLGLRACHHCMNEFMSTVFTAEPHEYAGIDFPRLLHNFDAVLDTPAPQLFPFLLAAFPNARVVHTVRDSMDWVEARTREHHSPKPGAALLSSLGKAENPMRNLKKMGFNITGKALDMLSLEDHNRSARFADAIAFSQQNIFYRCSTPPSQYFLVNAFKGDMCRPSFQAELAAFVNRTLPGGKDLPDPHCSTSVNVSV
jgi:hypothetical protein